MRSLLSEVLDQKIHKATLWCDNLSSVSMTTNPILHSRTKHIEMDLYFVEEKVARGNLSVNHMPVFIKRLTYLQPLSHTHFTRLRERLAVESSLHEKSESERKIADVERA